MFRNLMDLVGSGQVRGFSDKSRGSGRVGSRGFQNLTGRVGSGRVGSGRVGSGRVGSGRVGSGRVGSGRVGSGRVRPETSGKNKMAKKWQKNSWIKTTGNTGVNLEE